jgi:hypothetical protein
MSSAWNIERMNMNSEFTESALGLSGTMASVPGL